MPYFLRSNFLRGEWVELSEMVIEIVRLGVLGCISRSILLSVEVLGPVLWPCGSVAGSINVGGNILGGIAGSILGGISSGVSLVGSCGIGGGVSVGRDEDEAAQLLLRQTGQSVTKFE